MYLLIDSSTNSNISTTFNAVEIIKNEQLSKVIKNLYSEQYELTLQNKRDSIKKLEKEQPWKKTQETLKQVESNEPKTVEVSTSKKEILSPAVKRIVEEKKIDIIAFGKYSVYGFPRVPLPPAKIIAFTI